MDTYAWIVLVIVVLCVTWAAYDYFWGPKR